MKKIANFTLHNQKRYVEEWRKYGYIMGPKMYSPHINFEDSILWTEENIALATINAMKKVIADQNDAILIGGLSNVMCYAYTIAHHEGLEVVMARTPRRRDPITKRQIFSFEGISVVKSLGEILNMYITKK